MKVTKQVGRLLRQGKKPEELLRLGFSKGVISRVRRQLQKEKKAERAKGTKTTSMNKKPARPLAVLGGNEVRTPERLVRVAQVRIPELGAILWVDLTGLEISKSKFRKLARYQRGAAPKSMEPLIIERCRKAVQRFLNRAPSR